LAFVTVGFAEVYNSLDRIYQFDSRIGAGFGF